MYSFLKPGSSGLLYGGGGVSAGPVGKGRYNHKFYECIISHN